MKHLYCIILTLMVGLTSCGDITSEQAEQLRVYNESIRKKMTYEEAQKHSLTVRWKLETCGAGEECWCRILTTEEPIMYDTGYSGSLGGEEELYIAASGCVPTIYAERIVELHNASLKNDSYYPEDELLP